MSRGVRHAAAVRIPTPEEFLGHFHPDVRALAAALRGLVAASVPGVVEAVYPGWQLIGYRVPDGLRSRYFCFIAPLDDEVRLGFEYGVLLEDQALLEGDGSQVRYVALRSAAEVDPDRLRALIAEAAMAAVSRGRR